MIYAINLFEQLTLERVLDIMTRRTAWYNNINGWTDTKYLAVKLHNAGVRILGTSPEQIDNAESR